MLISRNYLHDNGATGIQIEDGSENIVVENNLSENNAQKYEFEAGAWIDDAKNVVVRNNILRSNKVGFNVTRSERVMVHDNFLFMEHPYCSAPALSNVTMTQIAAAILCKSKADSVFV